MYSCHSILECYNLFSEVKLSIFCFILPFLTTVVGLFIIDFDISLFVGDKCF